jgi:ketosteroid isomerase-like protein
MAIMTKHSIERLCERLVLDFVHFSDSQDYESLAALFTEDGTMVRPTGERLIGRAAIIESYRSRPAGRISRHICTNIRITVESTGRARGLTYAVVYSANANQSPEAHFGVKADPRQLIGEFEDEFVRTEEGWRIASRRARFQMHT